jgi:prophage antirepressor-like protein
VVRRVQEWISREVLPSLRKHGIYVVGQERVRTGEMSIAELGRIATKAYKSLAKALEIENKRVTAERDQFAAENV